MKILIVSVVFILALFSDYSYGQEFSPVLENITEGLPSTEVHDMFQDSIGYMWFATDRGICKYDGDRFQNIETEEYLRTNVIFKFFKERKDKIWLVTKRKRLYYFNPYDSHISFQPHPQNDKIETLVNNNGTNNQISDIFFKREGIYIIFRNSPGYLYANGGNVCHLVKNYVYPYDGVFMKIIYDKKFVYTSLQPNRKNHFPHVSKLISFGKTINLTGIENLNVAGDLGISDQINTSNGSFFSVSDYLFKIAGGERKRVQIPSRILCLLEEKNRIYAGTFDGVYELTEDLKIVSHYLKKDIVTKLFKDREGFFWISTIQNGVYLSHDFDSRELKFKNNFSVSHLFCQGRKGALHIYDDYNKELIISQTTDTFSKVYKQVFLLDKSFQHYSKDLQDALIKSLPFSSYKVIYAKDDNFVANITVTEGKQAFFVAKGQLMEMLDYYGSKQVFKFGGTNSVKFYNEMNGQIGIIGSNDGIFRFDKLKRKIVGKAIQGTEGQIYNSAIVLDRILLVSSNKGIFFTDKLKLKLKQIKEINHLRGAYKENDQTAWFYNDHEVFKISYTKGKIEVKKCLIRLGQRIPVILSLAVFQDKLWLATKKGLYILKIKENLFQGSPTKLKFCIDSVVVDGQKNMMNRGITLFPENQITFVFKTIGFDRVLSRDMEYSFDGKNWYETNKYSVHLRNLPIGLNLLKIRSFGDPRQVLFEIPIKIKPHFYSSWWFQSILLIMLMGVSFLLMRYYVRRREQRKIEKIEKLNLELKLLTSKMNPHFTFNTINSIQHYILQNDKKEAIRYLSDFAMLIRKSLDFSMEERITILQEMEFIELYVNLENKRFDANFNLKFQLLPNNTLLSKKIPSMLIQPLVENIILHANYKKNENKIIEIEIEYSKGDFIIKVKDFGEGIRNKKLLKDHTSYGLDILTSRVKMYNGKDFSKEDIKICSTNELKNKGTTITIKLKEWIQ